MTKLVFGPRCRFMGIRPELNLVIFSTYTVLANYSNDDRVNVNHITDGQHTAYNSLHYPGFAVDFDIFNLTDVGQATSDVAGALVDCDVILKSDHLHIEYQPKRGLNL